MVKYKKNFKQNPQTIEAMTEACNCMCGCVTVCNCTTVSDYTLYYYYGSNSADIDYVPHIYVFG
ncbi:MAG: hypothetical protein FWH57_11765 [Oscillospiraceae bacterium]|nr:hypothetical protein [Oscillospiraceae bacterium]